MIWGIFFADYLVFETLRLVLAYGEPTLCFGGPLLRLTEVDAVEPFVVESVLEAYSLRGVLLQQLDQQVLAFWSEVAPAGQVEL